MQDLSARLRGLREQNGWTVADMAERTGIPKRTMDKYMLRTGASLPGFDALCSLSVGLGVSLDWLVFGSERAGQRVELFAERAAYDVVKLLAETLIRVHCEGRTLISENGQLLGLDPEEWAADLAMRAAESAKNLAADGVTEQSLLTWRHQRLERIQELLSDRISHVTALGTGN